jgi:hypothetical protein
MASQIVMVLAITSPALSQEVAFEHTAGGPRVMASDRSFSVYWALWRRVGAQERSIFRQSAGSLITQREIVWKALRCDGAILSADRERFWFQDRFLFEPSGELIPIPEATRPDHFYIVGLNINGQHLLLQRSFEKPKRTKGEGRDEHESRIADAYAKYLADRSLVGTKGQISIRLEQVAAFDADVVADFLSISDMALRTDLQSHVEKHRSTQWPVFHDERAHKPHTPSAPKIRKTLPGSSACFHYVLEWNWCRDGEPPVFEFKRLSGPVPTPGPTRPGRGTSGQLIPLK